MIISGWCLTLTWPNIGLTLPLLHYLPFACGLFGLGYLLKASGMIGQKQSLRTWRTTLQMFATTRTYLRGALGRLRGSTKTNEHKGTADYKPIAFAFVFCGLLAYAVTRVPDYPVYEFHNVKVLKQVAPNKWWMEKDDGPFLWTGCPDFPNAEVIWAGYVARKVRFEELGKCKSILRYDLGFWWQRDSNYNAKGITQ